MTGRSRQCKARQQSGMLCALTDLYLRMSQVALLMSAGQRRRCDGGHARRPVAAGAAGARRTTACGPGRWRQLNMPDACRPGAAM